MAGMCVFMGLGNRRKGAGQDLPSGTSLSVVGPLCISPVPSWVLSAQLLRCVQTFRVPVSSAPVLQQDFSFLIFNKLTFFFFALAVHEYEFSLSFSL